MCSLRELATGIQIHYCNNNIIYIYIIYTHTLLVHYNICELRLWALGSLLAVGPSYVYMNVVDTLNVSEAYTQQF